jgi:HPt (histidine-containing phosphotransfer) domain-containing protein
MLPMSLPDENSALVDFSRVREIGGGDASFEQMIFGMFIEESEKNIAALIVALETGDLNRVRGESHSLKGAAANTGANPLSRLAAHMEATAKAGDAAGCRQQLDTLINCHRQTMQLLATSLAGGG